MQHQSATEILGATAKATSAPIRLSDEAVIPLTTLDPDRPPDDLAWLDKAIGDARVVAIGESAHYNRESYQLRHRLLRYLVERHGFSAYAMESGFVEGWLTDSWVRDGEESTGDPEQLSHVMANGITSLMGLWTEMRTHLEWMRQHNRTASHPVGFYGIDLPGSIVSPLPGLDAVTAYLAVGRSRVSHRPTPSGDGLRLRGDVRVLRARDHLRLRGACTRAQGRADGEPCRSHGAHDGPTARLPSSDDRRRLRACASFAEHHDHP